MECEVIKILQLSKRALNSKQETAERFAFALARYRLAVLSIKTDFEKLIKPLGLVTMSFIMSIPDQEGNKVRYWTW